MIRVWDSKSGRQLHSVANGGRILDIKFSPDGSTFAVSTHRIQATLYDAESLEVIRRFSAPNARFAWVNFSYDGKHLVTYNQSEGQSVMLWDIETGAPKAELDVGGKVGIAMHSSQPETLVWSDQDGAMIWRYEENERLPVTDQPTSNGAYSTDGSSFYFASWVPQWYQVNKREEWPLGLKSVSVTRWTREDLRPRETIDFSSEAIEKIFVDDQDRVFVAGFRRNQIVNHDVASCEPLATMAGHIGPISRCVFTSDSKRLFTCSLDSHVSVWNAADGKLLNRVVQGAPVFTLAISADDRYVVTGLRNGTCRIWDLSNNAVLVLTVPGKSAVRHVAFDPNATLVMAITSDDKAYVFDRKSGEQIPLDLHAGDVQWAEFAPDGTSILVVPSEHQQPHFVFLVPVDRSAATKLQFSAPVVTSHFHPDSESIVTATKGGVVVIQNARSGHVQQALNHELGLIHAAVFSPYGDYVFVSGGNKGTIWRVSDGKKWLTVEDTPGNYEWRYDYNPFLFAQPRRIVSRRSDNSQFRLWPLQPLKIVQGQLPRSLTKAEQERFLVEVER